LHRYFTHYWNTDEYRRHESSGSTEQFCHAASNQFSKWNIQPGDFIYAWTFFDNQLFLIGRMEVNRITTFSEAQKALGFDDLSEEQRDHAIAGSCTNKQFGIALPHVLIQKLEFLSPDGTLKLPKVKRSGGIEPQTFRGVRQLTSSAAALLDTYL
jgi:hypothetical protein